MTESQKKSPSSAQFSGIAVALLVALLFPTAIAAPAQTFKNLTSFNGTDGAYPEVSLVQARDGKFYGTTYLGGAYGSGTVFRISPAGRLHTVYSFCPTGNCTDGQTPEAALVLGTDGNFYGATGGSQDNSYYGTLFKVTPAGKLTTLHTFCSKGYNCTDGAYPTAALVQAADGNFYGTTSGGGANKCPYGVGCGTVFRITSAGRLTTVYKFCSQTNCRDGAWPWARLVQAIDGNFYGTTLAGGEDSTCFNGGGCGTVFKITPWGKLTTLHSFHGKDGAEPLDGLVDATDGNLYGTASVGGSNGWYGTVFKITPSGTMTTLYSFCSKSNCADGKFPIGGLVQATDGNLFGTTYGGGTQNNGTVFQITPLGKVTTLHCFDSTDGASPEGGVLQATNGAFYGTTSYAGAYFSGTVFSLSMGLEPFVAFVRDSGKVGATVEILGQGFIGTTGVSFNGTSASFTVHRGSYLTATVPAGATTGFVMVTTPKEKLKSNKKFRVIQ